MKALVTGGSGFIGSEVIRKLVARGIEVRALLRKTSSTDNLRGVQYETAYGDISDYASLEKAVAGVDYVFHLAGVITARTEQDYLKYNGEGTKNLALACATHNTGLKRFVYVSSLAASGPSNSSKPKTESDPDMPISVYGKSKFQGELELQRVSKEGALYPITIVRPPAVYGPRDKAILEFIKMVNTGLIPLFPSQNKEVSPRNKAYSLIYVEDLVDGIVEAGLNSNQTQKEIFYICDDKPYTWGEITQEMAKILNKRTISVPLPGPVLKAVAHVMKKCEKITKKSHPLTPEKIIELIQPYWICSNQNARDKLGFQPKWTLQAGMTDTIGWYKNNGWL